MLVRTLEGRNRAQIPSEQGRQESDHAAGKQGRSWSRRRVSSRSFIESVDQAHRGTRGPIEVTLAAWRNKLTEAFIAAGQKLGLPRDDGFNGADQEGIGYFELSQKSGLRSSTARSYLRPAWARPNLSIVTDALVERILVEDCRATGLRYRRPGSLVDVAAVYQEVILSAGAVNSPQLLQLSGIRPAALLKAHGIAIVRDLPSVGENLQDHVNCKVAHRVNRPLISMMPSGLCRCGCGPPCATRCSGMAR